MARLDDVERAKLAAVFAVRFAAGVAHRDLNPQRAAELAGVAVSTLRAWCALGRLGRRVGGRWRVTEAEVRALLAGGRA